MIPVPQIWSVELPDQYCMMLAEGAGKSTLVVSVSAKPDSWVISA